LIQKQTLEKNGHSLVVVAVVVVVVVVVAVVIVVVVCAANNQTNTYFYTFLRDKKRLVQTADLFHLL
jgi:flagellar basal body-associated protein FliL